jgi:4-hydroxythreonine-4-phosphate dehydrogenase
VRSNQIAVTLGDPCGIGPEIVAKTLETLPQPMRERVVVFGDRCVLDRAGGAPPGVRYVEPGVLSPARVDHEAPPGRPGPRAGEAQVAQLEAAAEAARRGELAAMVTAPISKGVARAAGFSFPGHTEFLADRLGARRVVMMFAGPRLKVALATVHVGLADVPAALAPTSGARPIDDAAALLAASLAGDFGIERPRIGVLGLNPHAGEGGLFGREELEVVTPAIERLKKRLGGAATVSGPLVPDAAFRGALWDAATGVRPPAHDALVALYHDQGLIPVKLVDFEDAVNVTLGLPIVRTSPDHGVAYDIAGRGVARPDSFRAALHLAARLTSPRTGPSDSRHPR